MKAQNLVCYCFVLAVVSPCVSIAKNSFSISASNYSSTNLDSAAITKLSQTGYVTGIGWIEYSFTATEVDSGWYEIWLEASDWPTDVIFDGKLLGHLSLQNSTWPRNGNQYKVGNIMIPPGKHTLKFDRPYFPGLPYIHGISFKPSSNLTGSFSIIPKSNAMVFRKGDSIPLEAIFEKKGDLSKLNWSIRDVSTKKIVKTDTIANQENNTPINIVIPADAEGVFELDIKDSTLGHASRTIEYVVVDTNKSNTIQTSVKDEKLHTQPVFEINPLTHKPEYSSSELTVINDYVESNGQGIYAKNPNPDYFAYNLNLPDKNGFYLIETDYPDDKDRTFSISLVDEAANPYALDSGIITGRGRPFTNVTQTSQLFYYARNQNPKLLFLNWHNNQKIAIKKIRVYQIQSKLPQLVAAKPERQFGMFFEETLRFTSLFGALPSSTGWSELLRTIDRWAEWSKFIGVNVWMPSIANYQSMMWPSKFLPGYAPSDEDRMGLVGRTSFNDPISKDIFRLTLLEAEKNDIAVIGELNIPIIGPLKDNLAKYFDEKYPTHIAASKPWQLVSDEGRIGGESGFDPYLNPIHPAVQQWTIDIANELADRYKDSPAFNGIALRFMMWAFSSWQGLPSIHWGYEDYTLELFQKDTGIIVPSDSGSLARFQQRYEWLMHNKYNEWVNWRCKKIFELHEKIANILVTARPDLKLYLNFHGPDFAYSDWGRHGGWRVRADKMTKLGWSNMIKESGIDPALYKSAKNIVLSGVYIYEPAIRADANTAPQQAPIEWKEILNAEPITATAKLTNEGSESSIQFMHTPLEYDFQIHNIGIEKLVKGGNKSLRIAALAEPPVEQYISRYLNAMADGNITFISDGGLGYVLGQPAALRPFIKEYASLPKTPMKEFLTGSKQVALWHGNRQNITYYYLVNKSDKLIKLRLKFNKATLSERLTTGLRLNPEELVLEPYSLRAFKNDEPNTTPISIELLNEAA